MRRIVLGVTALGALSISAVAEVPELRWQSPTTGRTWLAAKVDEPQSLLAMEQQCLDRGMTLPDGALPDMEDDLFRFLGTVVAVGDRRFPHRSFRDATVRLFPLSHPARKAERYRSQRHYYDELTTYWAKLRDLCARMGNHECVSNASAWLSALGAKTRHIEAVRREPGSRIVFVDVMGRDDLLPQLEQEYAQFQVQKPSYETARTVLELNARPLRWSGLLCVSP